MGLPSSDPTDETADLRLLDAESGLFDIDGGVTLS
jgi:hypothetical protein